MRMQLQLRAGKRQLVELKAVTTIPAELLREFRDRLEELRVPSLSVDELIAVARDTVDESSAEPLVRQLLAICGVVRQGGHSIDDVMDGVDYAVKQQGASSDLKMTEWEAVRSEFRELLEQKSIRLTATAIELAYDYANLFRRSRILTDVRPLYNERGDAVEAAVVSYTLRLRYDSADGEHEVSVAMDQSDIRALMEQCERSLKKASAAIQLVAASWNVPVTSSGSQQNGQ